MPHPIAPIVRRIMSGVGRNKEGVQMGPLVRKRSTEKAALYAMGGEEHWIAKSQIMAEDGAYIYVPRWLAEKTFHKKQEARPSEEWPG